MLTSYRTIKKKQQRTKQENLIKLQQQTTKSDKKISKPLIYLYVESDQKHGTIRGDLFRLYY